MSRSKHTDPAAIRAARRLKNPRERRGRGDRSRERQRIGTLKAIGLLPAKQTRAARTAPNFLPAIIIHRTPPGFYHPLNKHFFLTVLNEIGPLGAYGLKSIELRYAPARGDQALALGRYHPPDRIVLYAQRLPPWRFTERLSAKVRRQLRQAGAVIEV